MSRYKVTSQTVQRALRVLKDEGLIVGKAGSGVFVREWKQRLWSVVPSSYMPPTSDLPSPWQAGRPLRDSPTIFNSLVDVAEVHPPVQVAQALGITTEDYAVMRYRVLYIDDEPVETVRSYYPVEIARGTALAEKRKIRGGSPELLANLGYEMKEFIDRVSVRMPTTDELEALKLPNSVPILRTIAVAFSEGRIPVEVSVMAKAGNVYELEYNLPIH
jgi:GntR family transcriptional regulator